MKDLMLIIAAMMPIEEMIESLKQSINDYESDNSDDNLKKIQMNCSLILAKKVTGGDMEGAIKACEKIDRMEQANELFNKGIDKTS